jgi:hypothetical protein
MPKKYLSPAEINSIEKIKEALIKACIKSRPSYFKPYLESEKVITGFPNKESFYKFLKNMLAFSRKSSIGELSLKISPPKTDDDCEIYGFYDFCHVYARLSIMVKESDESIFVDILPF